MATGFSRARAGVLAACLGLAGATTASPHHPDRPAVTAPVAAVPDADPVPDAPAPPTYVEPALSATSDTFALHSDPGSTHTIFLDFDGFGLSGTLWSLTNGLGLPALTPGPWDPDGNGPAFDATERAEVQEIWQRVAEDYAPFDVDVTTQDPGDAALVRSGRTDQTYGVRVGIVGDDTAARTLFQDVCQSSCGGMAYTGVYGNDLTPALVFSQGLGPNVAKWVADAASHEAGHTLGLSHDGVTGGSPYYAGAAGWGPLMGDPYMMPLSQWSDGGYADGNNAEDDVAQIASYLGLRSDESGGDVAGAVPLGGTTRTGYVSGRTDTDTYSIGHCLGPFAVSATPAQVGPDLDIDLQLLDAAGDVLQDSDPAYAPSGYSSATGLDAAITTVGSGGEYYVRVDGTGDPGAYDDYGSLGAYRIDLAGACTTTLDSRGPSAPTAVTATPGGDGTSLTLAWRPPGDPGSSPVTGYRATLGDTTVDLGAAARGHTFTGLTPDTDYVLTVTAHNLAADGQPASVQGRTGPATGATAPGAPGSVHAAWNAASRAVHVTWQVPASDGGSPVTGYRVTVDGRARASGPADAIGVDLRTLAPGTHHLGVSALNGIGAGASAVVTVRVPRLRAVASVAVPTRVRPGRAARVRVTVTGSGPVPTGRARLLQGGRVLGSASLHAGRVTFTVRVPHRPATLHLTVRYLGSRWYAARSVGRRIAVRR